MDLGKAIKMEPSVCVGDGTDLVADERLVLVDPHLKPLEYNDMFSFWALSYPPPPPFFCQGPWYVHGR